ncbi:hypothetical protein [Streptomyces hirsutus]
MPQARHARPTGSRTEWTMAAVIARVYRTGGLETSAVEPVHRIGMQ